MYLCITQGLFPYNAITVAQSYSPNLARDGRQTCRRASTNSVQAGRQVCRPSHAEIGLKDWASDA
jgi:hypothetical protein